MKKSPIFVCLALLFVSSQVFAVQAKVEEKSKTQTLSKASTTTDTTSSDKTATNKTSELKTSSSAKTATTKAAALTSSSGGGAVPGNIKAATVNVEPFSGSANLAYPIAVPPGRGGIQPNLALTYNSSSHQVGYFGLGWSLDMGSIVRSTKKGIPKYDNTDTFVLAQGAASDLVYDSSVGYYRTEVEGGFSKIEKKDSGWVVTDKKGTKYYFGRSNNSTEYDPDNPNHIFRWALDYVEDLNGNYMTIDYFKDNRQITPNDIRYTGNSKQNSPAYVRVLISYIDRINPNPNSASYIAGFKIGGSSYRADRINIRTGINFGNSETSYQLTYKSSEATKRDLLQSIQQIGVDGQSTLPAVSFAYSENTEKGFQQDSSWNLDNLPAFSSYGWGRWVDLGVRTADLNGDAYPDLIQYSTPWGGNTTNQAYLSNKQKGWTPTNNWKLSMSTVPSQPDGFDAYVEIDRYNGVTLLDVNGDGLPDNMQSFRRDPAFGTYIKYSALNNSQNGFVQDSNWNLPNEFLINYELGYPVKGYTMPGASLTGDVNGDGFVDLMVARTDWAPSRSVFLNRKGLDQNDAGWISTNQWPLPSGVDFLIDGCSAVDINADGLADIACFSPHWGRQVNLNNGHGWEVSNAYSNELDSSVNMANGTTQLIDVNGDGLPDLVIGNQSRVLINTGNGWRQDDKWYPPNLNIDAPVQLFMDANADGMTDYLFSNGSKSLYINKGKPVDMLVHISNGLGATTDITYESSAHYQNTYLPFILQVVKSTSTTVVNPIGEPSTYTTSYDYSGGLWDTTYREFLGFKTVKIIDADGNYTMTTFAQDHFLKGRPIEQASYDKNGVLLAKSVNKWNTQDIFYSSNVVGFTTLNSNPVNTTNAQIDSSDLKFGQGSVKLNGASQYAAFPNSTDLDLGSDDFTVEAWLKVGASNRNMVILSRGEDQNYDQIYFGITDTNKLWFYMQKPGADLVSMRTLSSINLNDGAFHHVAVVRKGANGYIYVDGLKQELSAGISFGNSSMYIGNTALFIGRFWANNSGYFLGNIDEIRVSNIARWNGNFTPSSQAYTKDNNTKLLLHFDSYQEQLIPLYQSSKLVYLARTDNYLYDSQSTAKRTAQEFKYEQNLQYGDPTQVINYGEVDPTTGEDIGTDKIVTKTDYVGNTDKWIIGLPKVVTLEDINSKLISKVEFYYDGSSDNSASPSLGQLTKKVDWIKDGATGPQSKYAYDAYGNLKTTTDALGRITSITYDNDVHMFPTQISNALGHITKTSYYGLEGVSLDDGQGFRGLWGQTKSSTDANNQTAYSAYDVFGRPTLSVGPLDAVAKPTSQRIYEHPSNYTKITSKARVEKGQDETIDSVSYYDGLGRLIETKSLGPVAGQYIVSGLTEYNNRGLPVKQYLPRFTDKDLNSMDVIDTTVPAAKAEYDAMGRTVKSINPDGSYSSVIYDRWTTSSIDANGHKQVAYKDAFGRLIQKEEYTGADGRASDYPATSYKLYATTSYSYDAKGNLKSVMDAKGNVTAIKYDNLGRKIGMDDPDMGHWSYEYDQIGNLTAQTDANNKSIYFAYDSLNRLVIKQQINVIIGQPQYDSQGHPYNSYQTIQNVMAQYNYETPGQLFSKGRLSSVNYGASTSSPGQASFVYDQVGREIQSSKTIDNKAYLVNRQYNDLNQLKLLQYPDGAKVKYAYNQAGQIQSVYDPTKINVSNIDNGLTFQNTAHIENSQAYLGTGSLSLNGTTDYAVAPSSNNFNFGNEDFTIDFWFKINTFNAGVNRRVLFNHMQVLGIDNFYGYYAYYMPSGEIYFRTSNGTDTHYLVSPEGSVKTGAWYHMAIVRHGDSWNMYLNGASVANTLNSNPIEPANVPLEIGRGSDTEKLYYHDGFIDEFRVSKGIARWISNFTPPARDYGGSCDSYTKLLLHFDGKPESNQCISGSQDVGMYVKDVSYNALGQMTKVAYGNGVTTSYNYDSVNKQLKNISSINTQNQKLQDLSYTYDALGQITKIDDDINTSTQVFKYDALNRLVQAIGNYGVKKYTYDEIGNITLKDGLIYSYGELNSRIGNGIAAGSAASKAGPHAVTSLSDGTSFKYDPNGNMIQTLKGTEKTIYTYDDENRLTQVNNISNGKTNTLVSQYFYDGDGGRTKKIVYRRDKAVFNSSNNYTSLLFHDTNGKAWPGTATNTKKIITKYVGNLVEEEDQGTDGNPRYSKYIYLGSTKIAAINGQDIMYFHTDHLGGTNVLSDKTGLARELTEYDPFGLIIKHENYGDAYAQMWSYFTGKSLDDETGLMFYGARYYNPKLGRFITPDTIVQNPGGNPQTLNRYTYCNNNPVNNIDPSGHKWSWSKFWKSAVAAVVSAVVFIATGGTATPVIAGFWAGMAGGAVAGALSGGGWQAVLQGAAFGAVTGAAMGGIGAWGADKFGSAFGWGALAAGGGFAAATGNLDSFVGGVLGFQMGIGVSRWAYDPRFKIMDMNGNNSTIEDGDKVFVNGILNDEKGGIGNAKLAGGVTKVAYNPSDGPIADITEAFLQKVTFTSSIDRQLAASLAGHQGISLVGHSQGAITMGNALINLGLRGASGAVTRVEYINTQISQVRAYGSALFAGVAAGKITYGSATWDPSNVAGPNLNPIRFLTGALGLAALGQGIKDHGIPQH